MKETNLRPATTLIGLMLALIAPLAGHYVAPHIPADLLTAGNIFFFALTAIVLLYVVLVERAALSSIGFRTPKPLDIVFAVLVAVVAVVGMGVIFKVVLPALHLKLPSTSSNMALLTAPFWLQFAVVTRAAISEEVLFRGYGMERLGQWTGSMWLAAVVTWAIFTFAHISGWGLPVIIVAGWGGLVLTAFYLWRRNLWANMLLHWLTDAAGFLLPAMSMHH